MKTTALLVLATMMMTTAACTSETSGNDGAASSDDALTLPAPSASGTDMYIDWRARAELRDALGLTTDQFNFEDVVVPGVLRVQHQYSVAVVRLEPASFAVINDTSVIDEPGAAHSTMGVAFPRGTVFNTPAAKASRAAAEKLFGALTHATETQTSAQPRVVETKRASANGHFFCTKTTFDGGSPEFECTIAGAFAIGGVGLLWEKR